MRRHGWVERAFLDEQLVARQADVYSCVQEEIGPQWR